MKDYLGWKMATSANQSATPILDMSAPLPRCDDDPLSLRDTLAFLVFVTLVAVGWKYPPLVPFVVLIVTGLVVVCVHEAGHVVAGLIVGFRFEFVEVGPLRIELVSDRLRVSLVSRLLGGGLTRMSLDRLRRVRRRFILYIAGGPAATFLTGGLAVAMFFLIPMGKNSVAGVMLLWFGIYSIVGGIGYLFMRRVGRFPSDSAQLWALARSRDRSRQLLAALALEMRKNKGDEDVQLNERWIRVVWASADKLATAYRTNWDAYVRAQDVSVAALHLEFCLANSGFLQRWDRDALIAETASFTAWRRNDVVKARLWFKRLVAPERLSPLMRTRFEASIECAQGQFDNALALVDAGLETLKSLAPPCPKPQYETSWAEWRCQIQERRDPVNFSSHIPKQRASISS
jgi:hypothetical protein